MRTNSRNQKESRKAAEKKTEEKKQEEARRASLDEAAESTDEAAEKILSASTVPPAEAVTINIVSDGITPSSGTGDTTGGKVDIKA